MSHDQEVVKHSKSKTQGVKLVEPVPCQKTCSEPVQYRVTNSLYCGQQNYSHDKRLNTEDIQLTRLKSPGGLKMSSEHLRFVLLPKLSQNIKRVVHPLKGPLFAVSDLGFSTAEWSGCRSKDK